jgi:hypothetical protein
MATKTKKPDDEVMSSAEQKEETAAEKTPSAVVLRDGWFWTPDGRKFNTRMKAERYLNSIKND